MKIPIVLLQFQKMKNREYWKAVTIACIGTGQTTADANSSISMSATGVANKLLENFVKKFK